MVGVGVSVENCVEAIEVRGHGLGAEVGRCVDDDIASAIREQDGWARALVVRIFRFANCAMASERGDAHRCAGTENS